MCTLLGAVPGQPLRPTDAICHWFVSENAVDIKHPAPSGPIDEVTFRWIMNEDVMATEKLTEGIRNSQGTCRNCAPELTGDPILVDP